MGIYCIIKIIKKLILKVKWIFENGHFWILKMSKNENLEDFPRSKKWVLSIMLTNLKKSFKYC